MKWLIALLVALLDSACFFYRCMGLSCLMWKDGLTAWADFVSCEKNILAAWDVVWAGVRVLLHGSCMHACVHVCMFVVSRLHTFVF